MRLPRPFTGRLSGVKLTTILEIFALLGLIVLVMVLTGTKSPAPSETIKPAQSVPCDYVNTCPVPTRVLATTTPTTAPTSTPTATALPTATSTPSATATPTPTATPNTPNTGGGSNLAQCPPQQAGSNLQVNLQTTAVNSNLTYICVRVTAGSTAVDLSKTVILDLPAAPTEIIPSAGAITTNTNRIIWSVGVLQPGQSATLVVGVNTGANNIASTVVTVSGSFSTGETFQRVITGLPGLTQIAPSGGSGSGTVVANPTLVPGALPSTGQAANNSAGDSNWLALALLGLVLVSLLGLTGLLLARKLTARR